MIPSNVPTGARVTEDPAHCLCDAGFGGQAPGALRSAGCVAEAIATAEQVAGARVREPIRAGR